ncbi:MAG: alpha/beta hydrolase [Aggregatilineales bacterium]
MARDMLFYPRRADMATFPETDNTFNGLLETDALNIGYRLFLCENARAFVLLFHGNGEIAADFDVFAPFYRKAGLSVLVVDYRGYGWSEGEVRGTALLSDAEAILYRLSGLLHDHDLSMLPRFVMGRSLGSAPAIHLAYRFPEQFRGLIVECGFGHLPTMLTAYGLPDSIVRLLYDPIGNLRKIKQIRLPLLLVHGEDDDVVPVEHGDALHECCPSLQKVLLRVPDAKHNVMAVQPEQYIAAIEEYLNLVV